MQKNYDVVIFGGGTAGCACAWMSAKLGLSVLLLEKNQYLGGAITSQLVIPAMKTNDCGLNTEFFEALIINLNKQNAQITYGDGNKGWFNPFKIKDILINMLISEGVDIILNFNPCKSIAAKYKDNKNGDDNILSIDIDTKYNNNDALDIYILSKDNDKQTIENRKKYLEIFGKNFVDASGDAILCREIGALLLPPEAEQAKSLRFIMGGVDKKAFAEWLLTIDNDRNVTTVFNVGNDIHLSTACTWDEQPKWALKPVFDMAVKNGILKDTDRSYFQVFSVAGEADKIAFNCPRINTYNEGLEAINRLAIFCKIYFPGFENSSIYKIADSLGIRESYRVKGKYILSKEDIYNAKKFDNPVAFSNYPIDVHSIKKDNSILEYAQKTYSIPLESLCVEGFQNLYVIGRCLSADFYAQAAVRIQPTCFSMGVGLAKYLKSIN